jgi:MFS family permease
MSVYGFGATPILLLCSTFNLAAFIASMMLITDPLLVLERSLANLEKNVNIAYRGMILASKMWNGISITEKLKKENMHAFCSGLVLFSFATSVFLTPLPIFFSKDLALTDSFVFALFVLNSGGGVMGYFIARSEPAYQEKKYGISRITIFRSVLTFLLIAVLMIPAYNLMLDMAILTLMGFFYALFLVDAVSISMELMPEGKAGFFNVLVGIGGVLGSFIGPFLAQTVGFIYVFFVTGILFLLAYFVFKISRI